jgi:diamine N-acetyltransferase
MTNQTQKPVNLIEVTEENLHDVLRLEVADSQKDFVATNAVSIAQAYFEKAAWFRAIQSKEEVVGFVMMFDPSLSTKDMTAKDRAEMYLWRFMIDKKHQKSGYGRAALDLICDHSRTRPDILRLLASFVDAPSGPEDFYIKYGFTKTGNVPDGEVEIILEL